MSEKKKIDLYNEYSVKLKRFCAKNDLFLFDNALDVLEKCTLIFEGELNLEKPEQLTKQFFDINYFQFKRLSLQLKLPFKHELIFELFVLYCYTRTIINYLSKSCELCAVPGLAMTNEEIELLRKEQKYKTRQKNEVLKHKGAKFENYFYEFNSPFKIDVTGSLKLYDSIRRELLENGDTIELINNRDVITSVFKYYEYLSKGISIEREEKQDTEDSK